MTTATVPERTTPAWFKAAAWTWVGAIVVFSIVVFASGRLPEDDPFVTWLVVLAPFFAALAAVIASRVPGNSIAWLLGTIGTGIAFGVLTDSIVANPPDALTPVMLVVLVLNGISWVFFIFPILLTLFLFPNGHFLSVRWQWAGWLVGLMTLTLFVMGLLTEEVGPASGSWILENPWGVLPASVFDSAFAGAWNAGLLALALGGLASMVVRFRRASGLERTQIKWVLYATVLLAVLYAATVVLEGLLTVTASGEATFLVEAFWALFSFAFAFVPISITIAITRYKLYEIDLIIKRSLVFALLVGFITVVYAGVVVGLGSLVGGSNLGLSIGATAVVAVAFEPVRARVQLWVNRLVYGMRATPYEVLSDLTGRLAATESEERLLHRMAERLGEGTGAERASVWLTDDAGFRLAAASPTASGLMERAGSLDEVSASAFAVEHEGEVLGALSVEKARGDVLTPTERRLIEDLAGSAGLVMRRLRLDEALERKAAELEESRRRLLDAQDLERRRLERELHDGPQQQVVGLKVKLGLVQQLAEQEGTEQVAALAGQMASEAQAAIEQIRSLAQGIYPPLLQSDGLKAAVPALASSSPMDVNVGVELERRWPLPVEAAVYFCISEALTNAAKHGNGPITVSVSDTQTELGFEVSDCGPGFDPTTMKRGAGLNNMSDRLDVLGGSVVIASTPGGSTRVIGSVPFRLPADA